MNNIAQEKKAMLLEQAVINSSVEELSKIYDELGYVELSARALGLACRFRGLEMVKTLVEKGACFDRQYEIYYTNYAIYLLKIFGKKLKIFCLRGMVLEQSAKREQGKPLTFLSDEKRVDVLKYLFENREKIAFQPEEMLFYAIYFKDTAIVKELKKYGVRISEIRINTITNGAPAANNYWFEYTLLTKWLKKNNYLEVMQQLASELDGKSFHLTEAIYELTKKHFHDIKIFEFFLSNFKHEKMNRRKIMRDLIDEDILDALPIVEREGWLNASAKRDEMIVYASEKEKTEILAWLLDFKNRTADFAAEQVKAEKKMMRELNMSPDSAAALKKIWSYKKREDGTLAITNYRGTDIKVTVPERIGKGIVTAIGDGAFTGSYGVNSRVTYEQREQHRKIVKIALPKTLQYIGNGAFYGMLALVEINIPEEVQKIRESAFSNCTSLRNITIPKTVERIEASTFWCCDKLEEVCICEGVKEIEARAFAKCSSLQNITVPKTVEKIGQYAFIDCDKLEKVHICKGVKEIAEYAFQGCGLLKNITIPNTIEKIGKCAFADCDSLVEVCIYGEVKEMATLAFFKCSNLKEIRILKSIPNRVLGETFRQYPNLVVYCPKGSKTETYCMKKGIRFKNI